MLGKGFKKGGIGIVFFFILVGIVVRKILEDLNKEDYPGFV